MESREDKEEICIKNGIQLLTIYEHEWNNSIKKRIWLSIIKNKLGLNTKIYARDCVVKEVPSGEASLFLDENHLQGKINSSIRLGLYHNNELVQIMTFGKPRFNKDVDYELLRFATKVDFNVVGGASKLFKCFTDIFKGKILSYAQTRYSNGDVYYKLGFNFVGYTPREYFYWKGNKIFSRYQCQKHKLKDLLEIFDLNLTELENIRNNGFRKDDRF